MGLQRKYLTGTLAHGQPYSFSCSLLDWAYMDFLRGLCSELVTLKWGWVIAWRAFRGRWYIWRDVPEIHMIRILEAIHYSIERGKADDFQKEAYRQGVEEFNLRLSQVRREMETLLRVDPAELHIPTPGTSAPTPASEASTGQS